MILCSSQKIQTLDFSQKCKMRGVAQLNLNIKNNDIFSISQADFTTKKDEVYKQKFIYMSMVFLFDLS